jgi:transposase
MVAADARTAVVFALSPGNAHDAPEGRSLLEDLGPMPEGLPMLMDKAYEGNETRQLVLDLGMIPVVPPKSNRLKNPLSFYAMQKPTASGQVLGFAAIAPAEIKSAAWKLAQVLQPICVLSKTLR